MSNRKRMPILLASGLICLGGIVVLAADIRFAGKWKGEPKPAAAPAGAVGAALSRGGGGGGRGGGFGGSQKITLNLKHNVKENKISGNVVLGDTSEAVDVKEGRVEGNRFTFVAGRAPQPIYEYVGVMLKEDELVLTRKSPDGRTQPWNSY